MEKKDSTNIVLVAVLGILVWVLFFNGGAAAPDNINDDNACAYGSTTFTAQMTRDGDAGTSLSTADYGFYVLTDKLGIQSAATALTVSTDYDMQIMFGENATDYYTVVDTINMGCEGPKYQTVDLPYVAQSLAQFYVENSDGSSNSASNAEAFGADDEFATVVSFKTSSNEFFGNPNVDCDNVAVIEVDKTYVKNVKGGEGKADVPDFFTYNNASYDGAFAVIVPKSADGGKVSFDLTFESTSTDPVGPNYPIIHMYDCGVDKDEGTLELIMGVEDEDNNFIGHSALGQNKTVYIS